MLEIAISGYTKALHSHCNAVLQEAKSNEYPMELFKIFFLTQLSEIDLPKDRKDNQKRLIVFYNAVHEIIYKEMNKMLTILRYGAPYLPPFILLFVTSGKTTIF